MALLLENGDRLLLEDGSVLLEESAGYVPIAVTGVAGVAAGAQAPTLNAVTYSAVGFDSTADELRAPSLPAASPFTFGGWAKVAASTGAQQYLAILQEQFGGTWEGLRFASNGTSLEAALSGATLSLTTITLGTWVYVALTYDGTTFRAYWGTEAGGTLATASLVQGPMGVPFYFSLGADVGSLNLNGYLSRWRLWSAALTSGEVQAEYESASLVRSTGCLGSWPLANAANKLVDAAGSNNLTAPGAGPWTDAVGPTIPGGSGVTITPVAAGVAVGAQAAATPGSVLPAATGVAAGAWGPGLATTVQPGAGGPSTGAWAPLAGVPVAPVQVGVAAGAWAPALQVSVAILPGTAGVVTGAPQAATPGALLPASAGPAAGAWAPSLAATVQPGAGGPAAGAWAPGLALAAPVAAGGAAVGAWAPALAVAVSVQPGAAGVATGGWSLTLTLPVLPAATGAGAGAWPPALSAGVVPAAGGPAAGAWAPALAVGASASSSGVDAGAWAPSLAVVVAPGAAGVVAGAWSASVAQGLVPWARWELEDAPEAGTAADSTGRVAPLAVRSSGGWPARVRRGPSWGRRFSGNGTAAPSGLAGRGMSVADYVALVSGEWTASWWMRREGTAATSATVWAAFPVDVAGYGAASARVLYVQSSGQLVVQHFQRTGLTTQAAGSSTWAALVTDFAWHHLVARKRLPNGNPASDVPVYEVWRDGVQVAATSNNARPNSYPPAWPTVLGARVGIGETYTQDSGGADSHVLGADLSLDNLTLFNRALTDQEVAAWYAEESAVRARPGQLAGVAGQGLARVAGPSSAAPSTITPARATGAGAATARPTT